MAEYENPFKLNLPKGWDDQTVYHFKGPDIDGQSHTLMLTIARRLADEDIEPFARDRINPIVENLQGLEVLKDEETTVEGCFPSHEFACRWIPGEGVQMIQRYVFVIAHGMGFTFSSTFSKKSHKLLGEQMKDVIESVLPGTYQPLEED
jgi:hypothetical protein